MRCFCLFTLIVLTANVALAEKDAEKKTAKFAPDQKTLPAKPPKGAIVLFDGKDTSHFLSMAGGKINWPVEDGALVSTRKGGNTNHIVSKLHFRDADIHVEFMLPAKGSGNSGIYIHGNYELQIQNSYGKKKISMGDAGAVYGFSKPLVNACRKPGEWQVYDIRYRAPRRDEAGKIIKNGTITAWLNGQKVQEAASFGEPRSVYHPFRYGTTPYLKTIWKQQKATSVGPVFLQDHSNAVRFRNVWLRPLDEKAFVYEPKAAASAKGPLRVFVLVGQSNMQGKGKIQHLDALIADKSTAGDYKHLKQGDQWARRDDVWIKYWDKKGKLTVGYGSPTDRIGPELGFGHVVGEKLDRQILIIKVAWGGQSLGRDFRPPSAGLPSKERLQEILDRTNKNNKKRNRPLIKLADVKAKYGQKYRETIAEVHTVLADIKKVFPAYDGSGYELSGLVWFQGFNDVINDEFRAEYGKNMVHFIRDIRRDLGVADLPIVIGELGMAGPVVDPRYAHKHYAVRKAQEAPSKMPQFKGSVAYARTSPYVVKEGQGYDGGYHYRGRADTFYKIGESFGKAMLPLLSDLPKDHTRQVSAAGKQAGSKYGF
ncbi:MAG: DUF1080 domain-containing protein [Planctomycetes bacterium]|nr:DUF1080 domain-containing protein [Planctomycetota bacterium]